VLCFRHLQDAVLLLAIWIGIGFIFRGTATTVAAISDSTLPGRGWEIFVGVLSLIAGVVVMASPWRPSRTVARRLTYRTSPTIATCKQPPTAMSFGWTPSPGVNEGCDLAIGLAGCSPSGKTTANRSGDGLGAVAARRGVDGHAGPPGQGAPVRRT